jgi:hypothetical protein
MINNFNPELTFEDKIIKPNIGVSKTISSKLLSAKRLDFKKKEWETNL